MKVVIRRIVPILLFLLAGFTATSGFTQQTQASLTGQVLDPQGATIADATVVVTNTDTSIARTAKTAGNGRYTVTNLNPGKYEVTVQASGFSEKKLTGIVLAVGQDGSLDVPLALGASNEVVEVTASAAVTSTEDSSQGTVIDNQKVVGLPLNQRTFYGLALLSPAAYMPGQSSTLGFRGGFNVAGNNETANTFTVNGIDDNDQNVMVPSFRPSVEAIQEFKLLTGVYDAEYGRTSGGQVVVVTKTGTNQLHGDVFEFIRNSQFDAKNYFTIPNTPTTFRRNQFGGTLGGPIIKDRTFFFLSYEGLRLAQPVVGNTNVPNPAFLTGDFSSLLKQATPVQLVNPATGVAYANNQIPVGSFDPIGLAILKLYPTPNAGYNTNAAVVPYTFNEKRIENLDEGSARVDHKFSDKDSILAQYNYFNDPSFEPSLSLCSSALIPGSGCTQNQISTLIGLNETHIFNAHWLNEARIGFDRLEQPRIGEDDGNTAFPKVPGTFSDPTIPANLLGGAPSASVTGYASIHPYTNLPQHRWDDHFNFVDNVSWSRGAHNFKFGVNLLQARYSDLYVADATGAFSFTGVKNSLGNLTTGNSAADLALGYAATATRSPSAPNIHVRYNSIGAYVQDDWKVTPRLTINVGVRYEDFLPVTDVRNTISNWLYPSAANPNGTIQVAGQGGSGQTVYNNDANNFAPRLGLSYQPFGDSKTVIHASYGVFYNSPSIGNGAILSMGINAPFRLIQGFNSANSSSTTNGVTTTVSAQSILSTNPYPATVSTTNGTVTTTTTDGSQAHPYTNVAPTGIDPNFRTLYLNEYGADVQQQLSPTIALTIGFIGNEGAKIPRPIAANQYVNGVKPIAGTAGPIANPFSYGYGGPLFFQWGNITEYISQGHSSYNAMTVKAQKNMSNGVSFILAYTWGKSMDNAAGYASTSQASSGTPQDSSNLKAERGLSDFNVTSRIALSPVIELPFGRSKPYLTHGLGAAVAGGWQLSGIYQFDTGRPFTVSTSTNNSGSVYGVDRPNVSGDPNTGARTVNQWFNTSVFTANLKGQFGNERRNSIIGPDYSDLDLAVQRGFALTERFVISVRAESFNVFNKANFLNPLGTGTGQFIQASAASTITGAANQNTNFGKLTQANDPRSMQFSAKLTF